MMTADDYLQKAIDLRDAANAMALPYEDLCLENALLRSDIGIRERKITTLQGDILTLKSELFEARETIEREEEDE